MNVYQKPLDYITLFMCTWNVSIVGVMAIFWHSPLWLQQIYLIIVSAATVCHYLKSSKALFLLKIDILRVLAC